MEKSIFQVTTKQYKHYYVLANGFEEAKNKAEKAIIDDDNHNILDASGSLNIDYKPDEVIEIKCLTNKIY